MDNLSEQNFKAVQAGFNTMDSRVSEQETKIKHLESTVTQLKTQVDIMNQHLQVLRVMAHGTGSTVRS